MSLTTKICIASCLVATAFTASANADLIAGWTIPSALTGTLTAATYTVGAANTGNQTAGSSLSGTHALATSVWSSPSGNGSSNSFSSNGWKTDDYYQVAVNVSGYENITFSYDQTRSSTGPATFSLEMSVNFGAFTTVLSNYAVVQAGLAGSGTTTWNPTTYQAGFTMNSGVMTSAANSSTVIFRIKDSAVTGATTGTGRVDNLFVSGTLLPAPGAVALVGLAGLVARRRRN